MKKFIIILIKSIISFVSILIVNKMIFSEQSYNIFISSIFFILFYFYYKFNIKVDKRTKIYSIILSIIISIILSIGSIVGSYMFSGAVNIFNLKNIVYFLIAVTGLSFLLYYIFAFMYKKVDKIIIFKENNKLSNKGFILMILVILLGYSLYFIRFYPAIMTNDSYYVLHYANNFILSDFHPFGHTWFVGIFLHLGKFIFNDINMAVGLVAIVQMICMSIIFASSIRYLYNKGLNKFICLALLWFYTLNPLHAHYSITIWRDILFGCSFVVSLISLYEFISNDKKIPIKYIILFIIGVMVMLFFRNNGIYVFIFMIPFMIIFIKKHRKFLSILSICILIFYFVVKGPIFSYFNIAKTTSVEAFSIPLQQLARVIASGREIEGNDREYLEKLFDYDNISLKYNPVISDPIKNITNNSVLTNNKIEFLKTYFSLFIKYPNVYIEAYLLQTYGYWYPDVIYWATAGESKSIFASEDIYSDPITPDWYNDIIDKTTSRKLPLSNLVFSVGLQFIILLISSFILCYKRNIKYLVSYIPLYGLWLSIMAATPVFCELRYVYGLFTCTPIIICLSLKNKSKEKEVSKN